MCLQFNPANTSSFQMAMGGSTNIANQMSVLNLSALHPDPIQCKEFGSAPSAATDVGANTQIVEPARPLHSRLLLQCRQAAMASKTSCRGSDCIHGTCFFNKCWCNPGFIGNTCDTVMDMQPPTCPNWQEWQGLVKQCKEITRHCQSHRYYRLALPQHNGGRPDQCFTHPGYGSARVPMERWRLAQLAESILWQQKGARAKKTICDRCREHLDNFEQYRAVKHLGHVAEVGCGPFTQVRTLLEARPDLVNTAKSITLADPGMDGYLKMKACPYRHGHLNGISVFPYTCGAEEFPFVEAFDTVVMLNVIEHAWDAFAVLSSVYAVLKPGGQFLFHERLLDLSLQSEVFHPIRLEQHFYATFLLESYETIYNRTVKLNSSKYPGGSARSFYYIGEKKDAIS